MLFKSKKCVFTKINVYVIIIWEEKMKGFINNNIYDTNNPDWAIVEVFEELKEELKEESPKSKIFYLYNKKQNRIVRKPFYSIKATDQNYAVVQVTKNSYSLFDFNKGILMPEQFFNINLPVKGISIVELRGNKFGFFDVYNRKLQNQIFQWAEFSIINDICGVKLENQNYFTYYNPYTQQLFGCKLKQTANPNDEFAKWEEILKNCPRDFQYLPKQHFDGSFMSQKMLDHCLHSIVVGMMQREPKDERRQILYLEQVSQDKKFIEDIIKNNKALFINSTKPINERIIDVYENILDLNKTRPLKERSL